MGTSAPSKGPKNSTPLVPTWLPDASPSPAPDDDGSGPETPDKKEPQKELEKKPKPAIPEPPQPQRFRTSRSNFNRFAKSGGQDIDACRKAVGGYVRSGTGGARNATTKMGASRSSAGNVLRMFQNIQQDGLNDTLGGLNLQSLSGKSPEEICSGLTEVICKGQEGGPIDEAIARDAWLETITSFPELGITDLEGLTVEQMEAVFAEFIAHSIEGRILQDIGSETLRVADELADVENIMEQMHDYIRGEVRDAFSSDLTELSDWNDADISSIVDSTYQEAFSLLETKGDE